MKILQFIPEHFSSPQAGISRHAYGLSNALAAAGHEVHVISAPAMDRLFQPCENLFHHHSAENFPANISLELRDQHTLLMAEALRIAEDSGLPDVIHIHGHFAAMVAAVLGQAWPVPIVATIHYAEEGLSSQPKKSRLDHEKWLIDMADAVVCPSEFLYHEIRRSHHVPAQKLFVIRNGVDTSVPACSLDMRHVRQAICSSNSKLLVYAGRLSPEKGVRVLLKAFFRLACKLDVTLVVAGAGQLRSELRKAVDSNDMDSRVFFTGHLAPPELYMLYRLADAVVVPSLYEIFGLVALEAMSNAAPVIASDVGGLPEIIKPGKSGYLVRPNDVDALCEGIEHVLTADERQTSRIALAARARAVNRFSWDAVIPKFEELFTLLTEGPYGTLS